MNGLQRLGARDWRRITPPILEADWPQPPVVPAEPTDKIGLDAIFEAIGRCCETCDLCGGPVMDETPGRAGLRMVDLWICPQPFRKVRASLQQLTHAVLGSGASPTDVYREDSRIIDWYSWTSNGELFSLRAEMVESEGYWSSHIQAGRCRAEDVIDMWQMAGDMPALVTRVDVDPSDDKEKRLRFGYFTRCLVHARGCQNAELDRLWPRVRSLAEDQSITTIHISPEDCSGRSVTFSVERSHDGRWNGGPWSPKN